MFTYDDFLKIWTYLYDNTDTNNLDNNTTALAISEQTKSKNFIENTIDQTAFGTDDYKRLKKFLIDWYASHRTIVTTQKNVTDIYSIPESHLNELFYCFGFDVGDSIKNLSYDNKILFFYDLVNLYKIKGTPQSLFKVLNYFNIPNVEICEYWLQKSSISDTTGDLVFVGRPILSTPGLVSYGESEVPFAVTLDDPHWMLTEAQVESMLLNNKIRLPSKSPYYGIRPTYFLNDINVLEAYIARKVQDDYDNYISTGTNVRNIRCSMGMNVSFLELYLGMIYLFKKYYIAPGNPTNPFLCYDGTSLPEYDVVASIYADLTSKPFTRPEAEAKKILLTDTFTRAASSHFLYGQSDAGNVLNSINSTFKTEIDYYILVGKEVEGISLLFQDYSTWLKNNIGVNQSAFPSFVLDFATYSLWYLDKAIRFFKPYRARLLLVEKVYNMGNPVEDSVISWDGLSTEIPIGVVLPFYDFDTADSHPSHLIDPLNENYYSREHFDSGSYFDIGASIDVDPSIYFTDTIIDRLNYHPPDATAYVNYSYNTDSTGNVIFARSAGGFVNFDEGGFFDSPFVSDNCQITVVEAGDTYEDIVFHWRCEGEYYEFADIGTAPRITFVDGSEPYSLTNDYNPKDTTPTYTANSSPTLYDSAIEDSEMGWCLRLFTGFM